MDLKFFKTMFSIPPEKPLTKSQQFTFVSAIVAYIVGGLSLIFLPDVWNIIFGFELNADRRGYLLLLGDGLMIGIGFSYVILARGKSKQVPGHGVILGLVLERLVYINWVLYNLYSNALVPLAFALSFSALDTTLSLITLAIWNGEIEGAGLKRYFIEIWTVVSPYPTSKMKPAYAVLQWIGYLQIIIGLMAPSFLKYSSIVPMETFGTHTEGLLLSFLATFMLQGWFHVLAGGDCNYSFLIYAIFYRVVWNIPFFLFAGLTSRIRMGLAVFLILFDAFYCLIISILLFLHKKTEVKNN